MPTARGMAWNFLYMHFAGTGAAAVTDQLIRDNEGPLFRRTGNLKLGQALFECVRFYEAGGVRGMLQEAFQVERLLYIMTGEEAPVAKDSPVDEAIHYLHEHLSEELTLSRLAGVARLSPYYGNADLIEASLPCVGRKPNC